MRPAPRPEVPPCVLPGCCSPIVDASGSRCWRWRTQRLRRQLAAAAIMLDALALGVGKMLCLPGPNGGGKARVAAIGRARCCRPGSPTCPVPCRLVRLHCRGGGAVRRSVAGDPGRIPVRGGPAASDSAHRRTGLVLRSGRASLGRCGAAKYSGLRSAADRRVGPAGVSRRRRVQPWPRSRRSAPLPLAIVVLRPELLPEAMARWPGLSTIYDKDMP